MLSLIIPVFNEEGAVKNIVERCHATLPASSEIIVVDDGSTDGTSAILRGMKLPNLRVLHHPKNCGNGAAIKTGLGAAKGGWILTIDADNTYFPEDIPKLLARRDATGADMVVGLRAALMQGPFFHHHARNLLRQLAEFCSGAAIADVNSGMRLLRKDLFARFAHLYPNRFSLHIALTVCAGKSGATVAYEPIRYGNRIGFSKLSSGFRGIGNFLKFLLLIPLVAARTTRTQK